jgi:hypothetical protein
LAGQYTPGKTLLMMLSNTADPLSYHWFVLAEPLKFGVTAYDGKTVNPVSIIWGRIDAGWGLLGCAYEIADKPGELSWWKKLWVKFTAWMTYPLWG